MKNLSRSQNLHEVFLNSFEQRWGGALKSPWGQLKIDAVYDPESQRWALASLIFLPNVHGIELNNFIPEAQEKPNLGAQSLVDRVIKGEPVPIMLHGTPFQERVWEAVKAIPSGTVVSYSWIADRIGVPKAVRAVGTAIGQNPVTLAIPCHRVIRSNGNIGGYRWGLDIKEKILKGEGIFFKDGYRVSSKKDFERFSKENTLI